MGKNKVLVKVHPEGKYVVDLDKSIDIAQARAALQTCARNSASLGQPKCCRVTDVPNKTVA